MNDAYFQNCQNLQTFLNRWLPTKQSIFAFLLLWSIETCFSISISYAYYFLTKWSGWLKCAWIKACIRQRNLTDFFLKIVTADKFRTKQRELRILVYAQPISLHGIEKILNLALQWSHKWSLKNETLITCNPYFIEVLKRISTFRNNFAVE